MEVYSNHTVCVCICVLPLDLRDYKILLSRWAFNRWNGMWKIRFWCKNIESLTSAERLQKLTMPFHSKTHWELLYMYNESCWGLTVSFMSKFTSTKTGDTHFKSAILGSDAIFNVFFFEVPVLTVSLCQWKLSSGLCQNPIIFFSLWTCFFLHDVSVICPLCIQSWSFPDSNSACSKGSALQYTFLFWASVVKTFYKRTILYQLYLC